MSRFMLAGVGETMQYIVHEYNDNTIRFILRYPGAVDADALRLAVHAVVFSVDVLHASFRPGRLRAWWKVNQTVPEDSCFTILPVPGDPMEAAITAALEPVLPGDACQFRCALAQGSDAFSLAVNISHLCADGSDGKYLLYKLAEAYTLIRRTGSAEGLVVKNGSRAAGQAYDQLSRQEMRTLLHSPLGGVRSAFPYPSQEPGRPRLTLRTIPAGVMSAARQRARECGASANDLLLTAFYHAYAGMPGVDGDAPMSVMGMIDLRRHCPGGDSAGLCNMSGSLCTILPDGPGISFSQTLDLVARQTRAAKEDPLAGLTGMPLVHGAIKALPLSLLLRCAGRLYGSFSIGLTNLGNMDCAALALDGHSPADGVFGGPLKKKPAMQVSAASFNGACTLCVAGRYTEQDAALLHTLLDGMAEHIARYAAKA